MNGSKLELNANGSLAEILVNDKDISNMVTGIDIKIRAGDLPKATVYLADSEIDMTLNSALTKYKKPNKLKRLLRKISL